jgi:hypothetical protein
MPCFLGLRTSISHSHVEDRPSNWNEVASRDNFGNLFHSDAAISVHAALAFLASQRQNQDRVGVAHHWVDVIVSHPLHQGNLNMLVLISHGWGGSRDGRIRCLTIICTAIPLTKGFPRLQDPFVRWIHSLWSIARPRWDVFKVSVTALRSSSNCSNPREKPG